LWGEAEHPEEITHLQQNYDKLFHIIMFWGNDTDQTIQLGLKNRTDRRGRSYNH
jgi:hypothetical protein